jgi:FkbM family methyltransferase
MSKTFARAIYRFANLMTATLPPKRRSLTLALVGEQLLQIAEVRTARGILRFACPTARSLHDPLAFHANEPETLRWIDAQIRPGETMWDIGANIGVYSLYAALTRGVRVIAFEPGAASFAALVRNIELNGVGDRVSAFCLALNDRTGIDYLHMANTGAGHSMHAFGQLETVQGRLAPVFSQAVPGITIDRAREMFGIPAPDHIKLDVDSIEEKILRGAAETLPSVRTIAMEIDGDSGRSAMRFLLDAGFALADDDGPATRNRIFTRARRP